jgi:hypothetical protein
MGAFFNIWSKFRKKPLLKERAIFFCGKTEKERIVNERVRKKVFI